MGAAWAVGSKVPRPGSTAPIFRVVLDGGVVPSSHAKLRGVALENARRAFADEYFRVALGSSSTPEVRVSMRALHRDRVYLAGRSIIGRLEVHVPRDRVSSSASPNEVKARSTLSQADALDSVRGLKLSLTGTANVSWRVRSDGVVSGYRPLITQPFEMYSSSKDGPFSALQRRSERELGASSSAKAVASLPFAIQLPESLPPSTDFAKGSIRYVIRGECQYKRSTEISTKTLFDEHIVGILSRTPLSSSRGSLEPVIIEAAVGSYYGASGRLRAAVTLPKQSWNVSERLSGDISLVLRAPGVEVTDIRVTVIMHRTLQGRTLLGEHSTSSKKVLARMTASPSKGEWAPTKDSKGRVALIPFAVDLPAAVVNEFTTDIFALSHVLRVEIFTNASDACQCMAHVPIHILPGELAESEDVLVGQQSSSTQPEKLRKKSFQPTNRSDSHTAELRHMNDRLRSAHATGKMTAQHIAATALASSDEVFGKITNTQKRTSEPIQALQTQAGAAIASVTDAGARAVTQSNERRQAALAAINRATLPSRGKTRQHNGTFMKGINSACDNAHDGVSEFKRKFPSYLRDRIGEPKEAGHPLPTSARVRIADDRLNRRLSKLPLSGMPNDLKSTLKKAFGVQRKLQALKEHLSDSDTLIITASDAVTIIREFSQAQHQCEAARILAQHMTPETIAEVCSRVNTLNTTVHGREQLVKALS